MDSGHEHCLDALTSVLAEAADRRRLWSSADSVEAGEASPSFGIDVGAGAAADAAAGAGVGDSVSRHRDASRGCPCVTWALLPNRATLS